MCLLKPVDWGEGADEVRRRYLTEIFTRVKKGLKLKRKKMKRKTGENNKNNNVMEVENKK